MQQFLWSTRPSWLHRIITAITECELTFLHHMIRWPNSGTTMSTSGHTNDNCGSVSTASIWACEASTVHLSHFPLFSTIFHMGIAAWHSNTRQEIKSEGTWRLEPISLLRPFESSEAESWKLRDLFFFGGKAFQIYIHQQTWAPNLPELWETKNRTEAYHTMHIMHEMHGMHLARIFWMWKIIQDLAQCGFCSSLINGTNYQLLLLTTKLFPRVLRQLDVTVWVGTSTGTPPALRDAPCWLESDEGW